MVSLIHGKYEERIKAVQSLIQRVSGRCEGTTVRGELRPGVAVLKRKCVGADGYARYSLTRSERSGETGW